MDQIYRQTDFAEMANKHSRKAFYAIDDHLEATWLAMLVKPMKIIGGDPIKKVKIE